MYKILRTLIFISLTLFLVQCQKERDKYYDKPDWVEGPLHEVLRHEGRFSLFLQLVEKSQYAASIKGNGLWTVFAPNDQAMSDYLQSKGYASVADIPPAEASKLVAYTMIYNKYTFDRLSNILSDGWDTVQISVKKRTPYYELIHKEFYPYMNDSIWVAAPAARSSFSLNDNNFKYLPFYMEKYFNSRRNPLTASAYNTFYDSPYTGKNVQRASVVKADIMAGNGIIHEIDRVNEPLPTIEKLLDDENYSVFKGMINKMGPTGVPYFYTYSTNDAIASYYKAQQPLHDIRQVYLKFYSGLAIPINCERYQSPIPVNLQKEAEMDGYTIFAPNNEAVQKFYDEVIADYYPSMDELSQSVLLYFINAHLAYEMVWPDDYKTASNVFGDFVNGIGGGKGSEFDRQVFTDIKPASNGFFYGSNDYIRNRYFETVYTEILLRPASYSLMYNALEKYFQATLMEDFIKCPLNGYDEENYTVLLLSDEQLAAAGFTWEWGGSANTFFHSFDGSAKNTAFADQHLQRLVRSHVFKRIKTADIDTRILDFSGNPSGTYDGYAYAVNDYGDMVRYKNGQIEMLGNYDAGNKVTPTLVKTFSNGQVFTVDRMLEYSGNCVATDNCKEQDMLVYIKQAADNNPDVSMYAEYMEYIMTNTTNSYTLSNDSYWTLLMPNNQALSEAISEGYILSLADIVAAVAAENFTPLRDLTDFFRYHMIPGAVYVNDGYSQMQLGSGRIQTTVVTTTALKILIDNTFLRLEKVNGNLHISTDRSAVSKRVNVVPGANRSNLFGAKAVLHEVDGYLVYKQENK